MATTTTSNISGDAQKLQMLSDRLRLETSRLRELLAAERSAVRSLKASNSADMRRERTTARRREAELQAQLNTAQRAQFEISKNSDCDECAKLRSLHEADLRRDKNEFKRKESCLQSQINELKNVKNSNERLKSECEQCATYKASYEAELRKERSENKKKEAILQAQIASNQKIRKSDNTKTGECEQCTKISRELAKQKEMFKELEEKLERLQESNRLKVCDLRTQHEEHAAELARVTRSTRQDARKLLEELKTKDRIIEQLKRNVQSSKKTSTSDHVQIRKLREGDRKIEPASPSISTAACDSRSDNTIYDKVPEPAAADSKPAVGNCLNERLLIAEVNRLQNQLQISEDVILQLKQITRDKDRRDQLTTKQRREMYYRTVGNDLEPVLEEDTDSAVSSAPSSLSPQPYPGIGPCFPQYQAPADTSDSPPPTSLSPHPPSEGYTSSPPFETPLPLDVWGGKEVENELTIAKRQVRELEKALLVTRGVKSDRHAQMAAGLMERVKYLEAREASLLHELGDLREQNELLEFRILELEECHDKWSLRSQSPPDTRDVWTDTESDSGVGSLCLEPEDAVRTRLLAITRSTREPEDKECLLRVLALLESLEALSREQAFFCDEKIQSDLPVQAKTQQFGNSVREKQQNRIVATVLPFTEYTQVEVCTPEPERHEEDLTEKAEDKKQLWNTLCLQESGIFEGDPPEFNSQGTQTEFVQEPPNNKSLDLTAEIQKLNQFRESIEVGNKTKKLLVSSDQKFLKEISFYKDRLDLLERKLQIFESSGDCQTKRLAERLNKEVYLASQVKDLSAKVQKLLSDNSRLEEERCELEEAENDTRLHCQNLEGEIETLSDRLKAMDESRINAKRKSKDARSQATYWENMVNKYEERNYELEERECELRHRLEVMECTTPAILLFNMWKTMQNNPDGAMKDILADKLKNVGKSRIGSRSKSSSPLRCKGSLDGHRGSNVDNKIRSLEGERDRLVDQKNNMENKMRDLEKELTDLRNTTTKTASSWGDQISLDSLKSGDLDLIKNLQELTEKEKEMKKHIQELEHRELAYMETLQQADDIWAEMETGYKKRISTAEESEQGLREKLRRYENRDDRDEHINELEENEKALKDRISYLEKENARLAAENKSLRAEMEQFKYETANIIQNVQSKMTTEYEREKRRSQQLEEDLRHVSRSLQEAGKAHQTEIDGYKERLSKTSKELVHLDVTNSELREEVDTLESKISELGKELDDQRRRDGEAIRSLSHELSQKDREVTMLQRSMDAGGVSAAMELKNAEIQPEVNLNEMAKRLSSALQSVERCVECAEAVSPDLMETVDGIRTLCELMGCQGPIASTRPQVPLRRRWL